MSTAEQLTALRHLRLANSVCFSGNFTSSEITSAVRPQELKVLSITDNSVLDNLDFLQTYPSLTRLSLLRCPNVVDLTPLTAMPVTSLDLVQCGAARIDGLQDLALLKDLDLDLDLSCQSLDGLPVGGDLAGLWLGVTSCEHLRTLEGITRWPNLTRLSLAGLVDGFSQVAALPKLTYLVFQMHASLSMLADLQTAPQIEEFVLGNWETENDLAMVARALPNIKKLTIFCNDKHRQVDLTPLRDMTDLAITIQQANEVLGTEHFPPGAVTRKPRPRT